MASRLRTDVGLALGTGLGAMQRGTLPPRYHLAQRPWDSRLEAVVRNMSPGVRILDVGAGATPSLSVESRPSDVTYVGLDVSGDELAKAPAGAYDETVVGDVATPRPSLRGGFDIVFCYRVLEHVRSASQVLRVMGEYLRPGGVLLAELTGTFAAFAILNRVFPRPLGVALLKRLTAREPDTVFTAHYYRCWHSAIQRDIEGTFSRVEVLPLFYGGAYFLFARPLLGLYLTGEELAFRRGARNLATHYLIEAVR